VVAAPRGGGPGGVGAGAGGPGGGRRRAAGGVGAGRLGRAGALAPVPEGLPRAGGGRRALARALAVEPRILLLDEPLAHLDPLSRKTLHLELARLHRDLAVTTIHVTRDAADALALSDRLAVLHDGRVQQVSEPADVYQPP